MSLPCHQQVLDLFLLWFEFLYALMLQFSNITLLICKMQLWNGPNGPLILFQVESEMGINYPSSAMTNMHIPSVAYNCYLPFQLSASVACIFKTPMKMSKGFLQDELNGWLQNMMRTLINGLSSTKHCVKKERTLPLGTFQPKVPIVGSNINFWR